MRDIQTAVAAYLEQATGIHTVCDRTRVRGEYPLLAVAVEAKGAVLLAGGALAERKYQVTVTAVSDREREETTALLSGLTAHLLRGVPMETADGRRILHPLDIRTRGEELLFTLELCEALPALSGEDTEAAETMETLHLSV